MNRSYRNTREIAEYANRLAAIRDMELLDRHGKPVQEEDFLDMAEAVDRVVDCLAIGEDRYETAAVLTMTQQQAKAAAALLKDRLSAVGFDVEKRLSYVDRNSSRFVRGLTVTPFYLAKGLEFDQVFAIFGKKEHPVRLQAEYICATRALHEYYRFQIEYEIRKG